MLALTCDHARNEIAEQQGDDDLCIITEQSVALPQLASWQLAVDVLVVVIRTT